MTSVLKCAKLLHNVVRFTGRISLPGSGEKFKFLKCQRIFNLSELNMRSVSLSVDIKKDDNRNFLENFEKEMYQLNMDLGRGRVFKEDFQKIFEDLKKTGELKHSQLILLLKCCTPASFMCSEKERIKMARDIWNYAQKLGMKFDISDYNALLSVFVKNNHTFSCNEFINNLEKAGLTPNSVTYRYLLRAFCQQGDMTGAKDLFNKLKSLNYPLNEMDFNSVILGYSKIGDFEKVTEILKIMKEKDIEPTSKSYAYLLCGYIEHNYLEMFEKTFNELYYESDVHLSDSDLLRIIYTLALNKYEDHIDMVMKRLQKDGNYDKVVTSFIQRFLHNKLDSVALKLLESVDLTQRSFNYGLSITRYILDHYISYRSPVEILNICEALEKKGYARVAVGYSLRKTFLLKDEKFIINFIKEMKARGLPVREHYYWPVLIQASKKGNEKLITIMKMLPRDILQEPDSLYKIIFPNYKFSEIMDDIEKLSEVGIFKEFSARYLFEKLLKENRLDEAERLVATYSLDIFRMKHCFNLLFDNLTSDPEKVEKKINIIFNIYCGAYWSGKSIESMSGNMAYFDAVISSLLKKVEDKEIFQRALKAMLEKKMAISSEAASEILKAFPDQNLDDIVRMLSDPNLEMELNEALFSRKSVQESPDFGCLESCLRVMLMLTRNNKSGEAVELLEKFVEQGKERSEKISAEIKNLYRSFLSKIMETKNEILMKKCFDLGTKMGILSNSKKNNGLFLLGLINCGNISEAIDKFNELLLEYGYPVACMELFKKCITEGKTEEVQRITNTLSEAGHGNKALTYLVYALVTLGETEKAKKVLDTGRFSFQRNVFLMKLSSKEQDSTTLKNFIKFFKDFNNFEYELTVLYKLLTKIYAEQREVDSIKNLCLEIQEKKISDEKFLQELFQFQQDLDVVRLAKSISIDFRKAKGNKSIENQKKISDIITGVETKDLNVEYLNAMEKNLTTEEVLFLATQLACQGDVDKVYSLVVKYHTKLNVGKIGKAFLMSDKVNEFFELLDLFVSTGNFVALNDCLREPKLPMLLEKDYEYFEKYKSLSLRCTQETQILQPVITCFVISTILPGKLPDAEEIVVQYSDEFKNLPLSDITKVLETLQRPSSFYENILSSKTLKQCFSDHLCTFYNKVIRSNCVQNNLDKSVNYFDQAVADGVEKSLSKPVIAMLKSKLQSQGKTHPQLEGINVPNVA